MVVRLGPDGFRVTWLRLGWAGSGWAGFGWGARASGYPASDLVERARGAASARLGPGFRVTRLAGRPRARQASGVLGGPNMVSGNLARLRFRVASPARRKARVAGPGPRPGLGGGTASWFFPRPRTQEFFGNPTRTPERAGPGSAPRRGPRVCKKGAWGGGPRLAFG